jgi:hypothetical protein
MSIRLCHLGGANQKFVISTNLCQIGTYWHNLLIVLDYFLQERHCKCGLQATESKNLQLGGLVAAPPQVAGFLVLGSFQM